MRISRIAAMVMAGWICLLGSASAQVGHPVKGSWLGYWGPGDQDQRRLVLSMDWQDNKIEVVINPGPKAVEVQRADIDCEEWTLGLEADRPRAAGMPARWVGRGWGGYLGAWTRGRGSGA
jgi:hypothetical protein